MPCLVCGEVRITQIHHLNRDPKDNRPENLMELCPTCHYLIHHKGGELKKTSGGWRITRRRTEPIEPVHALCRFLNESMDPGGEQDAIITEAVIALVREIRMEWLEEASRSEDHRYEKKAIEIQIYQMLPPDPCVED